MVIRPVKSISDSNGCGNAQRLKAYEEWPVIDNFVAQEPFIDSTGPKVARRGIIERPGNSNSRKKPQVDLVPKPMPLASSPGPDVPI